MQYLSFVSFSSTTCIINAQNWTTTGKKCFQFYSHNVTITRSFSHQHGSTELRTNVTFVERISLHDTDVNNAQRRQVYCVIRLDTSSLYTCWSCEYPKSVGISNLSGEADSSVGRSSDLWPRGRGFESARGKICTALFFSDPVFEIALVVEKDVQP